MAEKTPLIDTLRRWSLRLVALILVIVVVGGAYLGFRVSSDRAEAFDDPLTQFKYGSTGGDKNFGIPYPIWAVMPIMFRKYLPEGRQDEGWAAFGFIYEYEDASDLPPGMGRPRPVGTSIREYMGIERTFVNCAICHSSTVRTGPEAEAVLYIGMPANRIDLQAFQDFMIACALDERFTPEHILAQIDRSGIEIDLYNRLALRLLGIYQVRERILTIAQRFAFAQDEPQFGPGRFDTFSPAKALLNWPIEMIPDHEKIGVVDFPSIWLQGQREGLQLHWDGNNTKVEERNRSAAFGTGALPPILDRDSMKVMEDWIAGAEPPAFTDLFPVNEDLLARGQAVYEAECAACHGANGRDFTGERVGKVTPIDEIGTDRHRFDNYTYDLAVNQNVLYAEFGDERFQNFRKTEGYANMPLDGVWLRAPYLHNGSVPTLWDLLSPPAQRPAEFYRGYDVYDPVNVGFESRPERIPPDMQGSLFCYRTRLVTPSACASPPDNNGLCTPDGCPGNGNGGHLYGTTLLSDDKRALIEFLKTF